MGLDIGAAVRAVSAYPPASRPERASASRESRPGDRVELARRPEEPEIRAGFGENTLSPSGAALETLDSNLEAAARLVPTVQELRERARVTQAQRGEALEARSNQVQEFRRLETLRPAPNSAARNFVADAGLAPEPASTAPAVAPTLPAETDNLEDSIPREAPPAEPAREPVPARFDIRV